MQTNHSSILFIVAAALVMSACTFDPKSWVSSIPSPSAEQTEAFKQVAKLATFDADSKRRERAEETVERLWQTFESGDVPQQPTEVPVELVMFMAEQIVEADYDLSGADPSVIVLMAHVTNLTSLYMPPTIPETVWEYSQAGFVESDAEVLNRALGDDRSQWPTCTILFVFDNVSARSAQVLVYTLYDRGLSPTSRGGNGEIWELEKVRSGWRVVYRAPFVFWD